MSQRTEPPSIYQLRITLREISPLVWRRFLVWSDHNPGPPPHHSPGRLRLERRASAHVPYQGKDYGSHGADTHHDRSSAGGGGAQRDLSGHTSACAPP